MKLSLAVCVFLLLVFQYIETKAQSASNCWKKSNPCVCEYEDSNTGKTMTVDISNYFKYPFSPKPDESKYTYLFSPCSETTCEKSSTNGVACQYIESQSRSVSLGRIGNTNTWFINNPNASGFQFTINYKNGDPDVKTNKSRTTQVVFMYADKDMEMAVTNEDADTYKMQVSGKLVQPHDGKSGGGGGGKGGGGTAPGIIGIVIMILALGGIVTYFVVGGIYMYRVKGARGVEMIPNYTFWKEIPFLIKDGFFFTISPCYKRQGEYEKL